MSVEDDYRVFKLILEPILREELIIERKYCSPIPRGGHYETTASFKVIEGYGKYEGHLFWKDWGLTDQKGNRPEHLLMRLHNVTLEEAEKMLETLEIPEVTEYKRQAKYKLQVIDREQMNLDELRWWAKFNVGEDLLADYNVRGVDSLFAGSNIIYSNENGLPAFTYRGGDELTEWQFYQPEPKTFWRYGNFIYGLDQLPYFVDDLIICSGMKDGLCVVEASGIPFIAGSGEGAYKQIEKILPMLKRRAKRLWTLMDPDAPGVMATRAFKEELQIPPFPFKYVDDKMDIAKLSQTMGINWLSDRFKQALNRI